LIAAVETHHFAPIEAAEWRNARLDFGSLKALRASLARPPDREGLKLAAESLDELSLKRLAEDEDVAARCRDNRALHRLWEACQTPDFRKVSLDEHLRLVRDFFFALTSRDRKVPD